MNSGPREATVAGAKNSLAYIAALSLCLGLLVGSLDIAFSLPGEPAMLRPLPTVIALFGLLTLLTTLASFLLLAFGLMLGSLLRMRSVETGSGIGAFVLSLFLLLRSSFQSPPSQASGVLLLGVLTGCSILLGLLCFLLVSSMNRKGIGFLYWRILACAPYVVAVSLFLWWCAIYSERPLPTAHIVLSASLAAMAIAAILFAKSAHRALAMLCPLALALWVQSAVSLPGVVEPHRPKASNCVTPTESKKRNLILITVDTLRQDALSCYNPQASSTPNMDSLASRGARFAKAYAAAPWTVPSVVSILTGLPPEAHRSVSSPAILDVKIATLAERLQQQGYSTCGIWYNSVLTSRMGAANGITQGFDTCYPFPRWSTWDDDGGAFAAKALKKLIWADAMPEDPNSMQLTEVACGWLRDNSSSPFFLWLRYYDPHWPFVPPSRYLPKSDLVETFGEQFTHFNSALKGYVGPNARQRSWVRLLYQAEVDYIDDCIGKLVAALDEQGLFRNSVVVLTNDHGEELWEHGDFGHGQSLYDELIAAPLLICGPEVKAGSVVEAPVSNAGIAPTLLDMEGLAYDKADFFYPSLRPLLNGNNEGFDGKVLSSNTIRWEDRVAIVSGTQKMILSKTTNATVIHDLKNDPREKRGTDVPDETQKSELADRLNRLQQEAVNLGNRLMGESTEKQNEVSPGMRKQLEALGYL